MRGKKARAIRKQFGVKHVRHARQKLAAAKLNPPKDTP